METFKGIKFNSHDEYFKSPAGAVMTGSPVTLRVLVPHGLDAYGVTLRLWEDGQENLLNMIILFPLGILLPFIRNRKVRWWEGLFVGLAVSASIEILQLVLCRGLFEWDDMIHNGIGCMAGSILSDFVWKIWEKGRTGDSRNKK